MKLDIILEEMFFRVANSGGFSPNHENKILCERLLILGLLETYEDSFDSRHFSDEGDDYKTWYRLNTNADIEKLKIIGTHVYYIKGVVAKKRSVRKEVKRIKDSFDRSTEKINIKIKELQQEKADLKIRKAEKVLAEITKLKIYKFTGGKAYV